MVSGRKRLNYGTANGERDIERPVKRDIESAGNSRETKFRFRDAVFRAAGNDHASLFKKKLKKGIDRDALEKYRKSQDEVR